LATLACTAIALPPLPPISATIRSAPSLLYVAILYHGLAVQAAGGATREELSKVVDVVMRAWPS
jgi:hypothetical protein